MIRTMMAVAAMLAAGCDGAMGVGDAGYAPSDGSSACEAGWPSCDGDRPSPVCQTEPERLLCPVGWALVCVPTLENARDDTYTARCGVDIGGESFPPHEFDLACSPDHVEPSVTEVWSNGACRGASFIACVQMWTGECCEAPASPWC